MMDDLIDFLKFVSVLLAGIAILLAAVGGGMYGIQYVWERDACSTYSHQTGFPSSYTWSTACLLRTPDGRWVDAEAYLKNVQDVKVKVQ